MTPSAEDVSSIRPGQFSGRNVMITGGGRDIGHELALAMAHAGTAVVVTVRSLEAGQETVRDIEAVGGHLRLPHDVTSACRRGAAS